MWRLIVFLVFLLASVWFGLEILRHPGYLFIAWQPWLVQMPLWLAVVGLVLVFTLFYLLIDSVDRLQFLWYRLKNWLRFRREQRYFSKTQQGLAMLIEGRYKKAERFLLAGVNQSVEPLMNYLGAAKAAQALGALERRDSYIRKAYKAAPHADLAIGITQAELELEQHQLEQAVATLRRLRETAPRHPSVLRLLEKAYVRLGDWDQLKDLLAPMRKAKVLDAEQSMLFEKNVYVEMLRVAGQKNVEAVKDVWNSVPRAMKKNPDVVYAYVQEILPDHRFGEEVGSLIRGVLKTHYHEALATIYGTLPFENLNRQLVIAGAWLKLYGPKPGLLLTLGRLCVRVQLWGKAKDYFARCLALGPNVEASLAYGKLLEQLNEPDAAMKQYKEGLQQLSLQSDAPNTLDNLVILDNRFAVKK